MKGKSRAVREQSLGELQTFLLPSVKMKEVQRGGTTHEDDLHQFLVRQFGGYTVTAGSITGYWQAAGRVECNEHREYQVAAKNPRQIRELKRFLILLGEQLGEQSVFFVSKGMAVTLQP